MTAPIPANSLAAFACHPEQSRGRLRPEPESPTRTCFQRDRDRVVHSGAFRKLDFAAMSAAVSDELLDAIAVTGRPDEAREQLRQWEGLTDQVLLYPPTVGTRPERVRENLAAIVDTFGS